MRYKNALLPTLKEAPADAQSKSHVLLTRAGYVRRVGAGIYSFLPLGLRVLRRVEQIVREEMDAAGGQEVLLPALLPAEYFKETNRWELFGDTLLRLKDRKNGDYHLGPTHEEIITDLARREIQSYRELPKNLYQIQTKFRDEPRPRGGLLRGREFIMKDAYSFDPSEDKALESYEGMRRAYRRIFDRMGFDYRMVGADSGAMGGSTSTEFQVLVQSGEDFIAACNQCEYAENLEVAAPPTKAEKAHPNVPALEKIHTPGKGGITDVAAFLQAPVALFLKSLLYVAGPDIVMVVLRGDHEVNELKLARVLGVGEVRLASAEDVVRTTGAAVGYAGPVGFAGRVLIDADAAAVSDGITGANETDHHLRHVQLGRDFVADVKSIRLVVEGDSCPRCGSGLGIYRGIEAGHIFVLGTHYSQKMGATFLDANGEKQPLVMGCYGIGISRLVAAAVEQHHDENGIIWPQSLSPYAVHITQLGDSAEVEKATAELEAALTRAGYEPLVDDRDLRPGVKFKDADLIGIPLRITVGERSLKEGKIELKDRAHPDPKFSENLALDEAVTNIISRIEQGLNRS